MKWKKQYTIIAVVAVVLLVVAFWPTNNRYLKKLHRDKDLNGL